MATSNIKNIPARDYMMLGRLKSDCEYYLNWGSRNKKYLWAGDETEQIQMMMELYYGMPYSQRPNWLSETRLRYYSIKMTGKDLSVKFRN